MQFGFGDASQSDGLFRDGQELIELDNNIGELRMWGCDVIHSEQIIDPHPIDHVAVERQQGQDIGLAH